MQYPELHYRWEWLLESSPEQLWPLVSDTNRFNRDTGLPPVRQAAGTAPLNGRRRLRFSILGIGVAWEEEPFEWVRPQRFSVMRRYHSGPTGSMRVLAELTPREGGGTRLVYQVWVRARNPLGLVAIPLVMRLSRRRFGAAFHRCDKENQRTAHPSQAPSGGRLSPGGRERLATIQRNLVERTGASALAVRLCQTVERGDPLFLARVRPYVLADEWSASRRDVLDLCLHATRSGALDLQWDVLCPLCRGAKATSPRLGEVREGVHCDGCNIDFTANFERNVELTFKPNPAIRRVPVVEFCVAGPQVTPHVVVQQLLPAGVHRDLALTLEAGRYRLRSPGLPGGCSVVAQSDGAPTAVLAASPGGWPSDELRLSLRPQVRLTNETKDERLFVLERMAWTDQAVTAAEVFRRQAFRDLFSMEVLRPGQQVSVGTLTIVFTDLRESTRLYRNIGDAPAFGRVLDHFEVLKRAVATEDGAVVKTLGDAVMAVFPRPAPALRALLRAQEELGPTARTEAPLVLKAGMHHGPCIAVTLNQRLDYFGSTVNLAARLERYSSGEDVVVSEAVYRDPEVVELIAKGGLAARPFEAEVKGFEGEQFPLWRVMAGAPTASSGR